MRRPVRGFFDRLAGGWDERVRPDSPEHLAALAAAVSRLEAPPPGPSISAADRHRGAVACPKLPEARVTGLDISEAMIDQARAKLPADPSERVEFSVGGAERLPFAYGSFEPVAQISVPVFFDEVARVLAPGGHVVVVSSLGLKPRITRPSARRATVSTDAESGPSPRARRVRGRSSWANSPPHPTQLIQRPPGHANPHRMRSNQPLALPSSKTSTVGLRTCSSSWGLHEATVAAEPDRAGDDGEAVLANRRRQPSCTCCQADGAVRPDAG
jgi:SAM-dependent methyltransferase